MNARALLAANGLYGILLALVIVGALNWLLVAAFDFDLVVWITGGTQPKVSYRPLARALYIAVGVAALLLIIVVAARKAKKAM
jgi:uncharacterized protein